MFMTIKIVHSWLQEKFKACFNYWADVVKDIVSMFRGSDGTFSDKKVILFMSIVVMLRMFTKSYNKAIDLMGPTNTAIPVIPESWIYILVALLLSFLAPDAVIKIILGRFGGVNNQTPPPPPAPPQDQPKPEDEKPGGQSS